ETSPAAQGLLPPSRGEFHAIISTPVCHRGRHCGCLNDCSTTRARAIWVHPTQRQIEYCLCRSWRPGRVGYGTASERELRGAVRRGFGKSGQEFCPLPECAQVP